MSNQKTRWTDQQLKAIDTTDRSVMVAASAGTGKTAVLSERCSRIVSAASSKADISEVLVLTFTEAAAAEMQSRIAEQLRHEYQKSFAPAIKLQIMLLDAAQISTIHSFCKQIISDNFHQLGVDPSFSIIEPDEQALVKSEILEQIIEQAWKDEKLAGELESFLYHRDLSINTGFVQKIMEINNFLDSVPDKEMWLRKATDFSNTENVIGEDVKKMQLQYLKQRLNELRDKIIYSIGLDTKFADGHWSGQILEYLKFTNDCIIAIDNDNIKGCADLINSFNKPKWITKPKGFDDAEKTIIQSPVNNAASRILELAELAIINQDYEQTIGLSANKQTRLLIELVGRFNLLYAERKKQLNSLDFSDLEHFALKLLIKNNQPSETAIEIRNKYKFIFVDEYQDINEVQQAILNSISRADNVFGVGDVKQSIYGWRQAQPKIFLDKINVAKADIEKDKSLRVDLQKNFRSRNEILEFVNEVFQRIMTKEIADMDYDSSAKLIGADNYKPAAARCIELHILDEDAQSNNDHSDSADNDDESSDNDIYSWTSKPQRQTLVIGRKIKKLVEEDKLEIFDKQSETYRPITYSDVAILMRSPSSRINEYIEIFRLLDIPVSTTSNAGYFETTEITDCLNLLRIIDNCAQDIELASVLRSPFFNFSETQLGQIRHFSDSQNQKNLNFYECVQAYMSGGDKRDIKSKLKDFLLQIEKWRELAKSGSLADLIWNILREKKYIGFVSALPNGTQRKANLLKLHERAIQFENFLTSSNSISLARFIDFVQKLLDRGQDWSPAQTAGTVNDGIQIISVHKSKGLEFPVVFLAQLGSDFNKADIRDDCMFDSDDTIGLRIIDKDSKRKAESAIFQLLKDKKNRQMLAEEMRILYVAMTRAREKLILVGSMKNKKSESILLKADAAAGDKLPLWMLADCKNHLEWIMYALAPGKNLRQLYGITDNSCNDSNLFDAVVYDNQMLQELSKEIQVMRDSGKIKSNISAKPVNTDKLIANLSYRYPYESASKLQSKTSATKISSENLPKTFAGDDFSVFDYSSISDVSLMPSRQSKAQIGTATHIVIQNLDLANAITEAAIKNTIHQLVSEKVIASETADKINIGAILNFFEADPGNLALSGKNKIHREWQFTFSVGSEQFDSQCENESVIVQGIIDMIIETPLGIVVIDFKTDAVSMDNINERAAKYIKQLDIYSNAAEKILNKPVLSKWLYFLSLPKGISI